MVRSKNDTIKIRELTKSELLLQKIGELVDCDTCHQQTIMTNQWMMTANRDKDGNFFDNKTVCPQCQPELASNGELLVTI